MNRVFIDLETTGLNPDVHEIIECALVYDDDTPVYHRYVKANRMHLADYKALQINKYRERIHEWDQAISSEQLAFELAYLLKDKIIIGHNPSFDYSFIKELFSHHGQSSPRNQLVDTKTLAYEHLHHIGLKRLSLDSIRSFFEWSTHHNHTALKDALDCQRLYHKLNRASFIRRCFWRFKARGRIML